MVWRPQDCRCFVQVVALKDTGIGPPLTCTTLRLAPSRSLRLRFTGTILPFPWNASIYALCSNAGRSRSKGCVPVGCACVAVPSYRRRAALRKWPVLTSLEPRRWTESGMSPCLDCPHTRHGGRRPISPAFHHPARASPRHSVFSRCRGPSLTPGLTFRARAPSYRPCWAPDSCPRKAGTALRCAHPRARAPRLLPKSPGPPSSQQPRTGLHCCE